MRKNQGISLGVGTPYVSSTSVARPCDGKPEDMHIAHVFHQGQGYARYVI